ncbi:DUF2834 domain-containing protein [Abyssibacter profundi]|uniref:DUF2834 domain-containing protein n=1 Tax=Abyssibacter profundi TaxID=2182787 RepID=A0A383XQV6_9GAMM|nr:DUF2834 domain-containing protein [Abyssibacter profundi]PWN55010.1 DUF2834 domain-containing protein [Abyssibacter profundi]
MAGTTWILIAVTVGFGGLTGYSLHAVGYLGIWQAGLANPGTLQVLVDLLIVCGLAMLWMLQDARANQRIVWPYLLLTVAAGAFGPLLYLIHRGWSQRQAPRGEPRYG